MYKRQLRTQSAAFPAGKDAAEHRAGRHAGASTGSCDAGRGILSMAGRKVLWGILLAGALGLYLFANSAGTLCVLLAAALPLLSAVSLLLPRQITLTLSAPETVGRGEQMTCTLTVSSSGIPAQMCIRDREQRGQSLAALTARGRGLDCFQPQPRQPVLRFSQPAVLPALLVIQLFGSVFPPPNFS